MSPKSIMAPESIAGGASQVVLSVVVCARENGTLVAMPGMNTEAPSGELQK